MQLICLMGPTASGKTALAVELTKRLPCEIISVDSALVYKGLNIGTAKPNAETLRIAPHRLLDICDPSEAYSAGQFLIDARREIEDIQAKGKIPLLVGGTMLYFYVLQNGLDNLPRQNAELRQALQQEAEQSGWPLLHERLKTLDPVAAARIHPHDSQRIQRALEVCLLTGKPLSASQLGQKDETQKYSFCNLILAPTDRKKLHQHIEQRFLDMLELGFMKEVEGLYQRPELSADKPALRSVGYRQAWEYLSGKGSFEEMTEKAIIATRQLAKRQLTWLRRWKDGAWFEAEKGSLLIDEVSEFLEKIPSPPRSVGKRGITNP